MKNLRSFRFAFALIVAGLFLGLTDEARAQNSVPAYTTVVADSWSTWYWDCYGYDYHYDYDWFWGPSWYYGAGWYSGYDWTWTPSDYWYDYLNYYYCYYVWIEIYGTSLVQVPTSTGNCTYSITVSFSDSSTQSFTQQGTGSAINLYFTHSATDPVPTGATATEVCAEPTIISTTTYPAAGAGSDRVILGIGESAICHLSNNATATWAVSGDGSLRTGAQDSVVTIKAAYSPGVMTVQATAGGVTYTKSFEIKAPESMQYSFLSDSPLGSPGYSLIGAQSLFRVTVLPNTVNFVEASVAGRMQENWDSQNINWPNGGTTTTSAGTPGFVVDNNNQWTDTSSSGLLPKSLLFDQYGQNVYFSWYNDLRMVYVNAADSPVVFVQSVKHYRLYNETTPSSARVAISQLNIPAVYGGYMGPYY